MKESERGEGAMREEDRKGSEGYGAVCERHLRRTELTEAER